MVIRAIVGHMYIEWIHGFGDGNGRLGRALEFALLLDAGIPLVSAHVLQSHYNETRSAYYLRLNESSKAPEGLAQFLVYAVEGLRDGLNGQLTLLHDEQEQLMWRSVVTCLN